jgi:hypothetical protein
MKHFFKTVKLILTIVLVFLPGDFSRVPLNPHAPIQPQDQLFFLDFNNSLFLYDPEIDEKQPILPDWKIDSFAVNQSKDLGFSAEVDGVYDTYLLQYPYNMNNPVLIRQDGSNPSLRYSWSPNGRYLAYVADPWGENQLIIWNGVEARVVYQSNRQVSELTWSTDGRLAFTDFRPSPGHDQVMVWDGRIVMNVSQNLSGGDRAPAWSPENRLAFLADDSRIYEITIWDGVSFADQKPDKSTYTKASGKFISYYSYPVWVGSSSIAYTATAPWEEAAQIYLWDGTRTTNISQNPFTHNTGQQWNANGYWAFVTYFSDIQAVYIRNQANKTIYSVHGQYQPAWSEHGQLMYCSMVNHMWRLMHWNLGKVTIIAESDQIDAMWANGANVFCSSG